MGECSRKKRAKVTMSDDVEILINMVQLRPYLFNKSHKNYFNRDLKQTAWEDIASAASMTVQEAKSKWSYLRDEFKRKNSERVPSGSKAKRGNSVSTEFWKRLSFNEPFINQRRKTSGNYSLEDGEEVDEENETVPHDSVSVVAVSDTESGGEENDSNFASKPQKISGIKKSQHLHDRLIEVLETPEDEDSLFGASIAASLKKLSPQKRGKAKVLIQQALLQVSFPSENLPVTSFSFGTDINVQGPTARRVLSYSQF